MFYLKWVTDPKFKAVNPSKGIINNKYDKFIWIETTDNISKRTKVYFSEESIIELLKIIDNQDLHLAVFMKELVEKANAEVG